MAFNSCQFQYHFASISHLSVHSPLFSSFFLLLALNTSDALIQISCFTTDIVVVLDLFLQV